MIPFSSINTLLNLDAESSPYLTPTEAAKILEFSKTAHLIAILYSKNSFKLRTRDPLPKPNLGFSSVTKETYKHILILKEDVYALKEELKSSLTAEEVWHLIGGSLIRIRTLLKNEAVPILRLEIGNRIKLRHVDELRRLI